MSTSFLYHAFGIRGYRYVRTDYQDGQVIFTIEQEPETCRCSACGSRRAISRGQGERRFRALPLGSPPPFIGPAIPHSQRLELAFGSPARSPVSPPHPPSPTASS